jgi:hypothetical protein
MDDLVVASQTLTRYSLSPPLLLARILESFPFRRSVERQRVGGERLGLVAMADAEAVAEVPGNSVHPIALAEAQKPPSISMAARVEIMGLFI